jgi:DNA-binding HxlR family transcriptional regulator
LKLNRIDDAVLRALGVGKGTANEVQRRLSKSVPMKRFQRSLEALEAAGLADCCHRDGNPLMSVWEMTDKGAAHASR